MADQSKHGDAHEAGDDARERRYRSTQEAFKDLPLAEQTRFLIEATATTVARGIEEVARSVADEMDGAFRSGQRTTDADESDHPDEAARDATAEDLAATDEDPDPPPGNTDAPGGRASNSDTDTPNATD